MERSDVGTHAATSVSQEELEQLFLNLESLPDAESTLFEQHVHEHQHQHPQSQLPKFDLPQIEPFGVKEERPSPPITAGSVGLSASLFHKPRNSKGTWVSVLPHDRIR